MEYNCYIMEDVLEAIIDYRGKTPKKSEKGVKTLSAKSVKNGYIDYSQCYHISEDEYKRFMVRGLPKVGDVLLTTEAPMGMVARLDREDVAIAQRLLTLRGKDGVLDNDYLRYFLQSSKGQALLKARETGTTVTGIKQAEFRKIQIEIPDWEYQKKVVSVLKSLEDKIAINNAISNNLREQVRIISSSWLSTYEQFGGTVPCDWEEMALSEIAEFVNGYSYKGNELGESIVAMATIKNFDKNGGFKLDGYKGIVPSSKIKGDHYAELFDTLVAHTDLTQNAEVIGNAETIMSRAGYKKIVFSMDLVKVCPKKDGISKFLIAAILQDKRFKSHCLGYVNGTTVLHLSKKALPEYKLYLPKDFAILKPLDDILTALYKRIASSICENIHLERMRDLLLPKLISGELNASMVSL